MSTPLIARIGLALALGALAVLAFAPFDQKWMLLPVFASLFWLADGRRFLNAAGYGWLFGFAFFVTGIYWTFISTHVYGGAPAAAALALCGLLFSYMSLYPALAIGMAAWLGLFRRPLGWIGVPALWMLGELLRGWVYSGFPWLSLGYASLDTPLAHFAPLGGAYFVSALIVAMALGLYRALGVPTQRLGGVIGLVAPVLAGMLLPTARYWAHDVGAPLEVAIVQADVRQDVKFAPVMREIMLNRHRAMTESALEGEGPKPDLVLWPESALPLSLNELDPAYLDGLRQMLRPSNSSLIFGSVVFGPGGDPGHEKVYNSAISIGATEARYDKRHLVPFGEYFPIPDFMRPLMVWLGTDYEDMASGPARQPLFQVRGTKLFTGICFEDVFGSEFRQDGADANVLVNLTNDAWFGHSPAAEQHLQFSRMRTIEYSRWMARSTTTGISAFIDAEGIVATRSGSFDQELLRGSVQPRTGATPFTRYGDAPLWTSSMLLVAAMVAWQGLLIRRARQSTLKSPPSSA